MDEPGPLRAARPRTDPQPRPGLAGGEPIAESAREHGAAAETVRSHVRRALEDRAAAEPRRERAVREAARRLANQARAEAERIAGEHDADADAIELEILEAMG